MYCPGKAVLSLQCVEEVPSPSLCVFFFDRKRPMKAPRWWPVAVLLLGVAGLGSSGAPNKEGPRLAPYRPVLRFRHKVLSFQCFTWVSSFFFFFLKFLIAVGQARLTNWIKFYNKVLFYLYEVFYNSNCLKVLNRGTILSNSVLQYFFFSLPQWW